MASRRTVVGLSAAAVVLVVVGVVIGLVLRGPAPVPAAAGPVGDSATPGGPTSVDPGTAPSTAPPVSTRPTPTTTAPAPRRTTRPPAPPAPAPTTTRRAPVGGQRIRAYLTGYSYFDNTPPGSATISNPVLHQRADGTGTYADPITLAVGHVIAGGRDALDWPAGTRFYVPNLRRYFIAEDTCGDGPTPQNGPCHTGFPAGAATWLDLWVGGAGGSRGGADDCMDAITDVWDVVVGPPSGYAVVAGSVYGPGGCARQYGDALVAAGG